jgi:hypothetical protein
MFRRLQSYLSGRESLIIQKNKKPVLIFTRTGHRLNFLTFYLLTVAAFDQIRWVLLHLRFLNDEE